MKVCPTCGHCHPGSVGAGLCPCRDCFLLWSMPRDLMGQEARERYDELVEAR